MTGERGFHAQLEEARSGDARALTALYRGLHGRLLRYLAAHEPERADDIAYEVWLDVAAGLDRFEGDERDFRSWSFTIARRRLVEARRRDRHVPARGDGDDVTELTESDRAIRGALRRIATLPHQDAEVLLLRVVGGFTAEEVGVLLHRPTATVRSLQQRAIQRLLRTDGAVAA